MSNLVTNHETVTKNLQSLASYAIAHGFKALIMGTQVMIKDDDGGILTDNFREVREFLGY